MSVAVIGAGPAGLTSAYQLSKAGTKVDVFEASPFVGGLARSFKLWDQTVDLGPHRFFTTDPNVNKIWSEVIGDDFSRVDRLTRIYYKKKFFLYPLNPTNALLNFGIFEALRCMGSYASQKLKPKGPDETFEQWVVGRFGERLYSLFFKSYSEKLWGIPCHELDASFAAQRIKKLSLYEAVKNAVKKGEGNKHKTLVDAFNYPHGGTGMLYERMTNAIRNSNGSVHLKTMVDGVLLEGKKAVGLRFADGSEKMYDNIISSMPLSLLVLSLPNAPEDVVSAAKSLEFRNTTLVYLKVNNSDLFPDNWIYVHSPELKVGRVCNFRNWVPQLYGNNKESILCLEYWSYDSDPLWSEPNETLIERASKEIRHTGLIGNAEIQDGFVTKLHRSYPVYRLGYQKKMQPIIDYLNTIENFIAIGRTGSFKYNNQDHSILMGMLAAKNILEGTNHDLWEINTNYEYQEAKPISQMMNHCTSLQSPEPT